MAAVVRIKRRLEEEPLEALILNCKRQKVNHSGNDVSSGKLELSSTVLTLAGTIKEVRWGFFRFLVLTTFLYRMKIYLHISRNRIMMK